MRLEMGANGGADRKGDTHSHAHGHSHGPGGHEHHHDHGYAHPHEHEEAGLHGHTHGPGESRMVKIEQDLLAKNNAFAAENRARFTSAGITALNLVSSPGSGKSSLLADTIAQLKGQLPLAVIEGDQQTSMDAEHIRAAGAAAIQINTGKGCHLDAHMVGHAVEHLKPAPGSVLFIENVGNLVCRGDVRPRRGASRGFGLGLPEGEDKPLKYPNMVRSSGLMLITKIDLHSTIQHILESPEVRTIGSVPIDAFLGPSHVSSVIGGQPYEFFAEEFQRPVVIAGFEPQARSRWRPMMTGVRDLGTFRTKL